jgi:hypothetical protein
MFGLYTDDGHQAVESMLATDRASTCQTCFQLAALSLNVAISVVDISRPGYQPAWLIPGFFTR